MMFTIEDIIGEAACERYEITSTDLDKFTKLADNITREICSGGTHQERGKEYIISVAEMLYRGGKLDENIRDGVYNGEYSIPEIIFILLEILLHELYYVDFEEKLVDTSSHPLSFIYAWNIYVKLAENLGKKTVAFPFGNNEMLLGEGKQVSSYDEELEQETLEVISILSRGSYIQGSCENYNENASTLNDYLSLLRRKNILTQDEVKHAIGTDDIESTLCHIIHTKIFGAQKLPDSIIKEAFYQYYDRLMRQQRETTREKIDTILAEGDEDEDAFDTFIDEELHPLLSHLYQGIILLENMGDIGEELRNYDIKNLIFLAAEYDILDDAQAQSFIDMSDKGPEYTSQIIFQIFQIIYDSGYIQEIDIDEDDRKTLEREMKDHLYALTLLADEFTRV